MPRPRKSTYDQWLDQFTEWNFEDRAGALKALDLIHRTATQLEKKKQPEQQSLPGTEK